MFFAQKSADKFSRISLSHPAQKYAILNSVYRLLGSGRAGSCYYAIHREVRVMNRFYKKALAVLALLGCVALTGCSLKDKLSGTSGPKAISRPAVESAEVQFTHPAAGDTIAVFDTSAGVFKAVLFPTLAPSSYFSFLQYPSGK